MYRPARKTNPRHALSHGGPIVLLRMRHAHTENGGTHVETQGVTATGIAYRSLRKKGTERATRYGTFTKQGLPARRFEAHSAWFLFSSLPCGDICSFRFTFFSPLDMSSSYANGLPQAANQTYLANKTERGEGPVEAVRVEISRLASAYAAFQVWNSYSCDASCASAVMGRSRQIVLAGGR